MSKNELSSTGRLSSAAQLFLSTQRAAPSERSEANLLKLRAATQAYIAPAVRASNWLNREKPVTTEIKSTTSRMGRKGFLSVEFTPVDIK